MHGKQLVKKFSLDPEELDRLTNEALGAVSLAEYDRAIDKTVEELAPNKIVRGTVIKVQPDGMVVVDVNYKAEGRIPLDEFDDPLAVEDGMEIECLVEGEIVCRAIAGRTAWVPERKVGEHESRDAALLDDVTSAADDHGWSPGGLEMACDQTHGLMTDGSKRDQQHHVDAVLIAPLGDTLGVHAARPLTV